MKNTEKKKSRSFEDVLKDPALAHVHDAIRILEKTPGKDIFPKKYELSMIDIAVEDTIELFEANPNMPLKNVLSTIISSFDDDLSADLILKMTKSIIKEWQNLSASLQQDNQKAIAV